MEFTASQITLLNGVKRTRLQQWLEREYLSPSIQKAYGHGGIPGIPEFQGHLIPGTPI
jgi:hypothetical protein